MKEQRWLEFVDEDGRKVRVTISGHWSDLAHDVETVVRNNAQALGLSLSDYEDQSDDVVTA